MKQKKHRNILNWSKDVTLKAFAIFILLIAGYYAYGAVAWPPQPNDVSGVVGTFVGESNFAYKSPMDYRQVNAACQNTFPDSHVCTPPEMANSYNHGTPGVSPVYLHSGADTLWINSGPPGFTANSNDCQGWIVNPSGPNASPVSNPNYGTVWDFQLQRGEVRPCNISDKRFACCQ